MKKNILFFIFVLLTVSLYASEPLKIRVMTYNLRFGELASLEELAMHIKSFSPDFVALQEVDCNTQRERAPKQNGKNFISELAYYTGMFGLYGKTIDYKGGYYGIGILSRYPYISSQKTLLPHIQKDVEQRAVLEGLFEMDGDTLIFASTHLDAQRADTRELQADFICNHFMNVKYPLILGGDFNSIPSSNVVKTMEKNWFSDPDVTPTIPSSNPVRRIDFLFAKPMKGWKVIRSQPVFSTLSDHLPVVTDLEYHKIKLSTEVRAARDVIYRQIGSRAADINLKIIPAVENRDVYEIKAEHGNLTLSGSSSVALCYAFHSYMKKACHSLKTWGGEHFQLPDQWPDFGEKQTSPYEFRYFLNVCTFGYTTPYWDWDRWEREIDWMALRGVNMPLATIANEAIAERVWMKMGLKKEEVRMFFTAPAHLPWHRMGNLTTWEGPLSDEWMEKQVKLQHKVLDRMHELGMKPIVPAFAGFVPKAFVDQHPEISFKHLEWGGFRPEYNAYVLPPDSPYFEEIGKLFVQEWEKEFGKHTYYLSDSFNEMRLPVDKSDVEGKHKLLAQYGESIYRSIAAGNKDAVWITQGWTFGYQHDFWDKESLKALLSHVPDDKMIIVDLGNDYPKWVWNTEQTWKVHDGFYGKKWIFSYVPNFGGKTPMTGDLQMYASSSSMALHTSNKGNLVGFGSAPEGLENNEVVYELLADMGWTDEPIHLNSWIDNYGKARYGSFPPKMKMAWNIFRQTAYSSLYSYPRFTWQTVVPDTHRLSKIDVGDDFLHGVELFLDCVDSLKGSRLYVNDAIEFAAYYLAAKADKAYIAALRADSVGHKENARDNLKIAVDILLKVDRLLASHPLYRLEPWVKMARDYGVTSDEKVHYEKNAKRLVTTWGGRQRDYAARFWSGLIKDYYIPRMELYFSSHRDQLQNWEEEWLSLPWNNSTQPFENALDAAIKEVNKLRNM